MVQEESLVNATALLEQFKAQYGTPELVVCDFSPNVLGAVQQIFGADVVQIDGFHVMRELNNGIKRDLLDFRTRTFRAAIRELRALQKWVNAVQKALQKELDGARALDQIGNPPAVSPDHPASRQCAEFTADLLELLRLAPPERFFQTLVKFLGDLEASQEPNRAQFAQGIKHVVPKTRYTPKGMIRTKRVLLQKLKAYFLGFRAELEAQSKQFYKDHWVLFFQPEHLTPKRQEKLDTFLTTYPELQIYRQMTVQMGEIYRMPPEELDGHQIDDLQASPAFSDKLNTAIRTLKKNKTSILRFKELYQKYPDLPKACRASMEYYNARFKAPFKRGNNLLKKDHLLARLERQFKGEIEWFLEEKAPI